MITVEQTSKGADHGGLSQGRWGPLCLATDPRDLAREHTKSRASARKEPAGRIEENLDQRLIYLYDGFLLVFEMTLKILILAT